MESVRNAQKIYIRTWISTRSPLKNVFWPNLFVGPSFQILEILQYSSGLKLVSAVTLNQNPIFERASEALSIQVLLKGTLLRKSDPVTKIIVLVLKLQAWQGNQQNLNNGPVVPLWFSRNAGLPKPPAGRVVV